MYNYIPQQFAQQPNPPRILISHSSDDKEFCDNFVELLVSIGFTNYSLIYTSKSEFGVPLGKDIFEYLRGNLENRRLWVFFMLSNNFYKSEVCLNEMGAAWVRQHRCFSILLPKFKHEDIKGVINRNQHTIDLCDPVRLTELLNIFRQTWQKSLINDIMWESTKNSFVKKIRTYYTEE